MRTDEGWGSGVVGARGGAGATVTAALLAAELARRSTAVLVETGPGPSVDTVLGLEAHPGLRWPDLTGARGAVDATLLAGNLMRWGPCSVLPADDDRPGLPPPDVLPDVLEALVAGHRSVVLDLDRSALLTGTGVADLVDACRSVLVVVPRDVPGVAGARVLHALLTGRQTRVGVVARGPAPGGLGPAEVGLAVHLPVVGSLPWSPGLGAAVDRGAGPQPSRAVRRAVTHLAGRLG
ncbi:pilus assembly protein FlpE [Cellulomonas endometrii]|uniref:pilus assembly protein FlpE n=1 Tax=Cellulomonas endometrii TaxID=3036301 RepID=UPI0024AE59FA|nr:pilus assembly protein FlpE [Cellulomonas endometrii]